MRTARGPSLAVAAAVGMAAAAVGHLLDRTGQLPFVHEGLTVRAAMSPELVLCWLLLAAALSALAAATGPMLVGAPCALLVAGIPELIGRQDLGAVTEPGAIAGALVQWLLIAAVVALALLAERQLTREIPPQFLLAATAPRVGGLLTTPVLLAVVASSRSRAPPS